MNATDFSKMETAVRAALARSPAVAELRRAPQSIAARAQAREWRNRVAPSRQGDQTRCDIKATYPIVEAGVTFAQAAKAHNEILGKGMCMMYGFYSEGMADEMRDRVISPLIRATVHDLYPAWSAFADTLPEAERNAERGRVFEALNGVLAILAKVYSAAGDAELEMKLQGQGLSTAEFALLMTRTLIALVGDAAMRTEGPDAEWHREQGAAAMKHVREAWDEWVRKGVRWPGFDIVW